MGPFFRNEGIYQTKNQQWFLFLERERPVEALNNKEQRTFFVFSKENFSRPHTKLGMLFGISFVIIFFVLKRAEIEC
jgi:hypothetical protein